MPDGDFDAQYAEVADEPRTSVGPLFEFGGTFDEKLADLCQDIVEEYEKSRPNYVPNIEDGEVQPPGGTLEDPESGGPYGKPSYAAEIRQLALEEFPVFFDAAAIDRFTEIAGSLRSAAVAIDHAKDEGSLVHLQSLMTHWTGPTASNFGTYLDDLETRIVHQLAFVGDVGAAAAHFEELMKRMRVDAYGLAKNLMVKVDPPSNDAAILTNALLVAGVIAAGFATFGGGAIVGVAGWATVAEFGILGVGSVVQVQQSLQTDEEGDREISGEDEEEYIPSCRRRIEEILTTGQTKAELVMGALEADMAHVGFQELIPSRLEIIGERRYDEDKMTLAHGFEVGQVAELRRAGTETMPVMAQYFEQARESVSQLGAMFTDGVGQSVVAGSYPPVFARAANALEEAFTKMRDDLYRSGQALTAIADNYARTEEQYEEMWQYYKELLNDTDGGIDDKYKPRARSKPEGTPVPAE